MDNKTAGQLDNLSPAEQRILLAKMLGQRTTKPKTAPLSFAQERLWFLGQLYPDSAAYNMAVAIRLTGRLDAATLRLCLDEIARRHEALRTTFATVEDQPVQVIAPALDLALPLIDLQHLPQAQREAEAQQLAADETHCLIDLARGPLVRTTLLRLSGREHILLLTTHHLVSDGWSMGVLVQEMAALYRAFSSGATSPLPDLPLQYADFAAWQRQQLRGETLRKLLAYWQQKLGDSSPALELPLDRPRPLVQTSRGQTHAFTLPLALSQTLQTFSHRTRVTLFMTLLAAFKTLLYRYTEQDDILVGTPIANRSRSELEELIGFFANTLVLRTDLSGNPSFRELLSRVRETALAAQAHQDVPFEKLVEELRPERDRSRSPLFQVMFVLQTTPALPHLPGLSLSLLEPDRKTAKFDLSLAMTETEQGLKGFIEYNTDLFDAPRITRMAGHLRTLLQSIVTDPERPISDLAILPPDEQQQVLVAWNDTQMDYRRRCLHQLVEAQAARTPDAVAVTLAEANLTYGELNRRANQLAHHLLASGRRTEEIVGLYVERSIEMVVGLLGILKAGGAYVPLDAAYPAERLAFILADSRISALLTTEKLAIHLPPHSGQVIRLDADWQDIAPRDGNDLAGLVTARNVAYVIYTSGSTGQPKGVSIAHHSVANMVASFIAAYTLQPGDRILQQTSLCFDVSVGEIAPILCAGGALVLLDRQIIQFEQVLSYLAEHQITIIGAVPSVLSQLNERLDKLPHLRLILSGGEALSFGDVDKLISQATVTNGYGPTETTICSAFYKLDRSDFPAESHEAKTTVSIGRPITNTQIYLLDGHLQPVPIGVAGELYIGGGGLARGYHYRPELSAAGFVPNPFSDAPGARLYRTGDLARYRQDGAIEFLGRLDHQVKIRGFRVELEEIGKVLAAHPTVQEAIVVALEDTPGQKRLVAYVVFRQEIPATNEELSRFLKERLPAYMAPSAFVTLAALPLTPSGKVDRQALPAPGQARPDMEYPFVAPRTPLEKVLADIWQTILGLEKIGVHDSFFELGGHSLLATQIVSHVRQSLGIELPLGLIFQVPTISELAVAMLEVSGERAKIEKTAELLIQVAQLSEEEVETLLAATSP